MSYAPELYDPIHIIGYTGSIVEGTSAIYFQMPLPDGQDVCLAIGRISTATNGEQGRVLVLAGNDFQVAETPEGINFLLDGIGVYQDDEPFISIDETTRGQLVGIIANPDFQHLLDSQESLYQAITNLNNDSDGMPFVLKAARAFILADKITEAQEVTGTQDLPQTEGTLVVENGRILPGLQQLVLLYGDSPREPNSAMQSDAQSGGIAREYPAIGMPGRGGGLSQLPSLIQQLSVGSNSNTVASSGQELPQAREVLDTPNPRGRGPRR